MGKSWTSADGRQYSAKCQRQVLQGSCAICPLIWQQDLEPHDNRLGMAWGVSHSYSLPDGQETQAKEGTASWVGIPAVLQLFTGVQYGHPIALHWRQEGHNLLICGRPADLQGMQGRRTEEGIAAGTVVVGTEDESGWQRCRQSQQIMAPWLGWGKAFGQAHLNSGNGFIGNAGRTIRLSAGGSFTAPLRQLCHHPCLPLTKGRQVWWMEIAG